MTANAAPTIPANPNVVDFRQQPWPLPMNEEIQFQNNGGAAGAEDEYGLIWITPSSSAPWMQMPPTPNIGAPRILALVSATIVLTAHVWSPFVTITFTNTLKGGVYQVNGAYWVVANGLAFRHSFPRAPMFQGRKLTPGGLTEAAYGNVPWRIGEAGTGVHGWFNYFEPFQVSVLGGTTTGSTTYNGYLDLTYMGNSFPPGAVPGT